jgi:hypothetical protein
MTKPLEPDNDEHSTMPDDSSSEDVAQLLDNTPHDPDVDAADRLEKADEIADDVEADADDLTQLPE